MFLWRTNKKVFEAHLLRDSQQLLSRRNEKNVSHCTWIADLDHPFHMVNHKVGLQKPLSFVLLFSTNISCIIKVCVFLQQSLTTNYHSIYPAACINIFHNEKEIEIIIPLCIYIRYN